MEARGQRPIDSRTVPSGVDEFETFETKEPAVRARDEFATEQVAWCVV